MCDLGNHPSGEVFETKVGYKPIFNKFLHQRKELNLSLVQAEARLKDDIKAINTITITIAAYLLCYVPSILYAVVGGQKENLADSWFAFIAWYSAYISSAVNPIIYYLRKSRCRYAFKQFLKDPFGSSDNGKKRHDKAMAGKKNAERVESEEACEVERYVSQTRQTYSGQRRNAVANSSIENLQAGLHSHHKVGDDNGYIEGKAKKGGEARANLQVQIYTTKKEIKLKKEMTKYPRNVAWKKSPRNDRHLRLEAKSILWELSKWTGLGKPEEEKRKVNANCSRREIKEQETSEKRRNAIRTGQKFEKVLKAAWIDEEE